MVTTVLNSTTEQEAAAMSSELAYVVGMNVERLRRRARLSKRKLSMMVGVSRPWLIQVEKGLANPRISQLEKLAHGLGTTTIDLLTPPFDGTPDGFYEKNRQKVGSMAARAAE